MSDYTYSQRRQPNTVTRRQSPGPHHRYEQAPPSNMQRQRNGPPPQTGALPPGTQPWSETAPQAGPPAAAVPERPPGTWLPQPVNRPGERAVAPVPHWGDHGEHYGYEGCLPDCERNKRR